MKIALVFIGSLVVLLSVWAGKEKLIPAAPPKATTSDDNGGPSTDDVDDTKCECAVFNTEAPEDEDKPIITQTPINVSCDDEGEEDCLQLCSTLAKAAKQRGPQLLCATLKRYKGLKASIHSRICGTDSWTYTGLTWPTDICCIDRQVIDCKNMH